MKRNPVQFQKGLSIPEFVKHYGSEQQCFEALLKWCWSAGFICPNCGHDRLCQLTARKLQQCNRCHRQTLITAGTIFDSSNLLLTAWIMGIYLLTQAKKGISAMQLHRQSDIR